MKVLVANDLYGRSSAAGVAVRMAEGLAARGHEVSFLATTRDPGEAGDTRENGVFVRRAHTPAYPLRFRAWRSLDNPPGNTAMAAAVADLRPDVVHVHNLHIHLGYGALAAARAGGARTVLHVHDVMPFCHQKLFCHLDERLSPGDEVRYQAGPVKCAVCVRGRYNPFRNGRIRRTLAAHADRVVAVSREMGRALEGNGIEVHGTIPNGIPLDEGRAAPGAAGALRERLGLGSDPVILYGGRLDRLKGGLELLTALALVRESIPAATLLLVGEALPGFAEEMDSLAGRLGLPPEAVVSTGWLTGDGLAAAYACADVVASPSLCFESFGLVNLEAMRASRAVVASFWGGPSDVVVDGVTGYLVNPLQVAVLADRLRRVLADPHHARSLGSAGRRRVEEVFSLEVQVDAVEDLYRELVT